MIELQHINKKYGKKQILQDISFQVKGGECVAIVGQNGCGKSTLLQIMAGVLKPDEGTLYYWQKDVFQNKKIWKSAFGYVPQENPLMEELTVKDNLLLWGWNSKAGECTVIEQFQLAELMQQKVSALSGGMKRRLSIACALLHNPAVMLLDEPTTALDLFYKEGVQKWIERYKKDGGIVVMTTHDENEILNADRCMVMVNGRLEDVSEPAIRMKKIREYIVEMKP